MGHYRSEMMTPDEVKAEAEWYKNIRSWQDKGWWTAKVQENWTCPVCAALVVSNGAQKHEKIHPKKDRIKAARAHQRKREKYEAEQKARNERS